jgi:hypothetical protein
MSSLTIVPALGLSITEVVQLGVGSICTEARGTA